MKKNVIFDLDGTLACAEHRRHYLDQTPKNWGAFFDECDRDPVIEHVAELFRYYRDVKDYTVFILSGRMGNVDTRSKTLQWLIANDLSPAHSTWLCDIAERFHMRGNDDYRGDVEVKKEMIDMLGLTPENTIAVFDDRNCMVAAWREWGFNCFQVAEGDF